MHKPVAALKHPPFNRNALSVPPALLTRLHTPSAANQRRFFDDFSDAFLERFWVDFGVPFGAVWHQNASKMRSKIDAKIDAEKVMENDAKKVEK